MRKVVLFIAILIYVKAGHAQATNYCVNQSYNTLEVAAGLIGTQPTIAQLNASQHGYSGGTWANDDGSGAITWSGVDMKALVAPGRLCADTTTYTNSVGSTGVVFTGQNTSANSALDYYLPASFTNLWASIEYNEDFPVTDKSDLDAFIIHGINADFATLNAYGNGTNRYFTFESPNGNGNEAQIPWTPPTQCPCKILIHYQAGNGTTVGTHELYVFDKNGLLLGHLTQNSTVAQDKVWRVRFGDTQSGVVNTVHHAWFDNLQVSVDGTAPGMFCAGLSPTWTSSPDNPTLASCLTGATVGDTVNVLSGAATWPSGTVINNSKGLNLAGATTCANTGTSSGSCTDNTILNWNGINGFLGTTLPASGRATMSGFTLNLTGSGGSNGGVLTWGGSAVAGSAGRFRFTGNHIIQARSSGGGIFSQISNAYGVVDHNVFTANSTGDRGEFVVVLDQTNHGYTAWNQPANWGTDQAVYFESNTWNEASFNVECMVDAYAGSRVVVRFNYAVNCGGFGGHGTDSNNSLGVMNFEDYGNTMINTNSSGSQVVHNVRSGTAFVWGNIYTNSGGGGWGGLELSELRGDPSLIAQGDWFRFGFANGTSWYANSNDPTNVLSVVNTSNRPNWSAGAKTAGTSIIPTANNAGNFSFTTFSNCTAGSLPGSWTQTVGQSTSDGGCTWVNSRGEASSGSVGAFCWPSNPDQLVSLGGACSTGGDTATAFFDGGNNPVATLGYPARNQPGRVHLPSQGEALAPIYSWNNSPQPAYFTTQGATTLIQECRDFYFSSASYTGTCATGKGGFGGLRSARPVTCAAGTFWFSTDQGNWNISGNGFGQGVLDVCGAGNVWTNGYYTPAVYPLVGAGGSVIISPSSESFGSISVGSSSSTQTATVTNTTTLPVTVTSVTTGAPGLNAADFPNTANTCSGTVPPNGGSCQVTKQFTPSIVGAESATLTVNLSSGSLTVALSGTGVSSGTPAISISPSPLIFGNVVVNQAAQIIVTVKNIGTANLAISSNVLTGGAGFNLNTGNCVTTLSPNATCTQIVVFNPLSTGNQTGTLTFTSNAPTSPDALQMSGSGILVPTTTTGVIMQGVAIQ